MPKENPQIPVVGSGQESDGFVDESRPQTSEEVNVEKDDEEVKQETSKESVEEPKKEDLTLSHEKDEDGEFNEVGSKVSLEDFLKEGGNLKLQKEEPKKEPEKQIERPVSKTEPSRDYSGLSEDEKKWFSRMSNDAFNNLKPIFLEYKKFPDTLKGKNTEIEQLKQGKVQLPSSYYDHPEAYTLTPEWNQKLNAFNTANTAEQHLMKQLIKIKKGEDWEPLIENEHGIQRLSAKPVIEGDEFQVQSQLNHVQQFSFKVRSELEGFSNDWKSKHKAAVDYIEEAATKLFPDFDKPDHPTAKLQKQIEEKIPESFRHHPLTKLVKFLAGQNALLNNRLTKMQGDVKAKSDAAKDTQASGPKKGETTTGATKAKKGIPSFDDFNKAKETD